MDNLEHSWDEQIPKARRKESVLNTVAPWHTKDMWQAVTTYWFSGLSYDQFVEQVAKPQGCYIPRDLWDALGTAFTIQLELDIGDRQEETW